VPRQTTSPLVVLGSGYTGHVLHRMGTSQGRTVHGTSRNPPVNLATIPSEQRLRFDLEQPSTWSNIPVGADLIWCFPATPLPAVQRWAGTQHSRFNRLVVLGSTSAYEASDHSTEYPPPWIDESAPIDLSKPRAQGEEFLRKDCGAIVLRVAGIYGPGRNPLDWIRQGRVGPSRKYVNLIHVEDLAIVCLAALRSGMPGEAYNVSDGTPRTWQDISLAAQQRWGIQSQADKNDTTTGKRIANGKLLSMLRTDHDDLRHFNFFKALEQIEHNVLTP
jgi:hypothetical protein